MQGFRLLWRVAASTVVLVGCLLTPQAAEADPTATSPNGNSLALTPPMGFNNWARFGCHPSETLILAQAKALVDSGLRDKGFDTVTIDDCWMSKDRDESDNLVADPATFPRGMAYVGKQLHEMGLKFGIYADSGTLTCAGYPGSAGHYQQDVNLFASWDVDYIKLDGCNMSPDGASDYIDAYHAFSQAMKNNASKRDMVFSASSPAYSFIGKSDLSNWYPVIAAARTDAQLWRTGYDVKMYDQAGSAWDKPTNGAGVLTQYDYNWPLSRFAGPGSWNDPDFLITGDGLTAEESRTQLALWSMMSAPLILSTDVTKLSKDSLDTLSNSDIIAIDQDPLGKQATMVSQNGTVDVLTKPLADGDRAVAMFNRANTTTTANSTLAAAGILGTCSATVKDLWTGNTSSTTGRLNATIPAHGTAVFRIKPGTGCTQQPAGQITGIGGKCLDNSASGTGAGNPIILYHCTGGANQNWRRPGDGTIRTQTGCLDAVYKDNDSRYVGYWAQFNSCDGRASQQWTYQQNGYVVNKATGRCLDAYNSSTTDGNPIIVDPCGSGQANRANRIWALPGDPS